jgi:hypothetical protein
MELAYRDERGRSRPRGAILGSEINGENDAEGSDNLDFLFA